MAGCGYVCPQCEGKGYLEDGSPCDWCAVVSSTVEPSGSESAD